MSQHCGSIINGCSAYHDPFHGRCACRCDSCGARLDEDAEVERGYANENLFPPLSDKGRAWESARPKS